MVHIAPKAFVVILLCAVAEQYLFYLLQQMKMTKFQNWEQHKIEEIFWAEPTKV